MCLGKVSPWACYELRSCRRLSRGWASDVSPVHDMLHVSSVPEFILQGLSVGKNAGVSKLGHGVAAGLCGFICNMAGKGVYSLLSRAYYYVGSICRDMDDIKRAVAFYRKAAEQIVDDRDFGLKSNAYSQIGRLMMLQSDCNMAARYYCLSYQTDSARRDTTAMVHSLLYMSMDYQREGRFDDGVSCLYRAVALGEKAKLGLRYDAYHRLSLLLCDSGDYNQAWRYVNTPCVWLITATAMLYAQRPWTSACIPAGLTLPAFYASS